MSREGEIDLSELAGEAPAATLVLSRTEGDARAIRRFRLVGVAGPFASKTWPSTAERCALGAHPSNDLVLDDPTVSRFHAEITVEARGVRVRDLGSANGTFVDGTPISDAWARPGSLLRLGRSELRLELDSESNRVPLSPHGEFGSLVGASAAMRATFAVLAKASASDATILLEGETGTGKERAAESIHAASPRRDAPFLVIDCSAIPANLLESELFGHEKGAFTGASARRVGVFEEASGGTVFLDEVGELPLDLQPKLLRVLERREVRRVGANAPLAVDVRLVAATNRDLRAEVNAGRFRSDLYFRLAVVKVTLPPLRQRPDDLPVLVERIVRGLGHGEAAARLLTPAFMAALARASWPGNVRELRNYLERCLVLEDDSPVEDASHATTAPGEGVAVDATKTYADARRIALDDFERRYAQALLALHQGKVAAAARAADMDRVYLYKLLHKHGLKR
jgi:two-component system response regulator GlrR